MKSERKNCLNKQKIKANCNITNWAKTYSRNPHSKWQKRIDRWTDRRMYGIMVDWTICTKTNYLAFIRINENYEAKENTRKIIMSHKSMDQMGSNQWSKPINFCIIDSLTYVWFEHVRSKQTYTQVVPIKHHSCLVIKPRNSCNKYHIKRKIQSQLNSQTTSRNIRTNRPLPLWYGTPLLLLTT